MSAPSRETFSAATAVEFSSIDATLRELWRGAASHAEGDGHPAAVRVTTMNLIVLAASQADGNEAHALAVELCARRPGRVLIVQAVRGEEGVRAEVATECLRVGGAREVCSETIRLYASGRSILYGSQLVAPLLVPDVPVVLWLPRHPTLLPVDDDLLGLVDRIVVDARNFPDAESALVQLGAWMERRRTVVDLAWLRLERWRCLTASLFADPASRADLDRADSVEVAYRTGADGSPQGLVEALYYLAWCAAGRAWRLGRGATLRKADGGWTLHDRSGDAWLGLRSAPRGEAERGDLTSVTLQVGSGTAYDIRRLAGQDIAELTIRAPRDCPLPLRVAMPTPSLLDLLARAVSPDLDDETYRRALDGARLLAHDL
jgi:glucose-6-phosphate dehydrogenase assembly protein OpcA